MGQTVSVPNRRYIEELGARCRRARVQAGDGLRASGISVWESKAREEGFYDAEWRQSMTRQYGVAPQIVYLHSPVMVDNHAGRIVVDEDRALRSSRRFRTRCTGERCPPNGALAHASTAQS